MSYCTALNLWEKCVLQEGHEGLHHGQPTKDGVAGYWAGPTFNALKALAKELATKDIWDSGEWSEWCHFCKRQKLYGVDYAEDPHNPDCLRVRAKELMQ